MYRRSAPLGVSCRAARETSSAEKWRRSYSASPRTGEGRVRGRSSPLGDRLIMKAMVLAAGLGTRLRPLTNDRPKALVEVAGRTLLEITLTRLRGFGIREVIINVHHFAAMVESYLKANNNFGLRIEISREEEMLLDTGGGLKKASHFFQEGTASDEPFMLHNVDVISNIDFGQMLKLHNGKEGLATLALQDRDTSRYLLFDESLELCGRRAGPDGQPELVRSVADPQPLAFSGIHVISPRFLERMPEQGAFSIIDSYLRVAGEGERILGFRADEYYCAILAEWRTSLKPRQISPASALCLRISEIAWSFFSSQCTRNFWQPIKHRDASQPQLIVDRRIPADDRASSHIVRNTALCSGDCAIANFAMPSHADLSR